MNYLKKRRSVLIQLLLVLCFMVSTGEAANKTLRNTAVNIDTSVKVDDATSAYTGLNSFTVDGAERAFQQWFWYRLGPAGGETSLDNLPKKVATSQPTPSSLLVIYTLAGQFDISVLYELTPYASGLGKASLKKTVTIKNIAATDLDFHLFEYSDFDISDTGAIVGDTDNIEVTNNKIYQNGDQTVGGVTLVHGTSLPTSKFDTDSDSAYLKPELKDTAPTDLMSPLMYNYGADMQFAQQWDLVIPVGQSVSFDITDSFYPNFPVTATKTHAGSCVTYLGQADYTISFDNLANTEGLTNVKIMDLLPGKTTPVNPLSNGGVYDSNANIVIWNLPTLAGGAVQQTEQLTIAVNSPTDISNELLLVSDQAFPTRITDPAALCNHPPAINSISNASINEGAAFSFQVIAIDPDKTPIFYELSNAPAGMTISTTGLISYPVSVAGTYVITVTATDSGAGALSASKTFTLTVVNANYNNPPVFTSTPKTTANDYQLYSYTITGTDPDGDTLNYFLLKAPTGMSITGNTITWIPTKDQAGSQTVQVMINDGHEHYVTQDFTLVVTHFNRHPEINNSVLPLTTATVATYYSYKVVASDPDGDALTYSLTTKPIGMTIGTTGVIGWTPTTDQNNKVHAVTVQVSDGLGGIATYSFNITVGTAVNYLVSTAVSGSGSINPNAPQLFNSGAGTTFVVNAATGYYVDGVSGCGGTLAGNSYATGAISADCTVTANFKPTLVKVPGNAVRTDYSTLQEAYANPATSSDMTILMQSLTFDGFALDRSINVTIKGGYDTNFQTNSGMTRIGGPFTIQSGSVIVEKLAIL